MSIQSRDILKGFITCEDEATRNKFYNLLDSFWHKVEGKIIKSVNKDAEGKITGFTVVDKDNATEVLSFPVLPTSKPISFITGLSQALADKVQVVPGKQLSTEDFTTELLQKLIALQNYVHPELHQISEIEGLNQALTDLAPPEGFGFSEINFSEAYRDRLLAFANNHYAAPVDDLAALAALPEAELSNHQRRPVKSEKADYFYDVNAVTGDVAPLDQTLGTGFWIKENKDIEVRIARLEGLDLIADMANQKILVKNSEGTLISELSVAWLNNEGTVFSYNGTTEKLELRNDANELLAEVPVSAFVSNLAKSLGLTGNKLQLKDTAGNELNFVEFEISNINGLTAALAGKQDALGYEAADASKVTKTVKTLIELREYVGTPGEYVQVLGRSKAGDGLVAPFPFYYSEIETGEDNDATIIKLTDPDTGAFIGQWETKIDGAVNVKWFGAKGDGVNDDYISLSNAFSSGYRNFIADGGSKFIISQLIELDYGFTLKSSNSKNVWFHKPDGGEMMKFYPSAKLNQIASSISDNSITIPDASSVLPDDLIIISSTELWYYDARETLYKGEILTVEKVIGNEVFFKDNLSDAYTAENLTVKIYNKESFNFENIGFEGVRDLAGTIGCSLWYISDSNFKGILTKYCTTTGFRVFGGYNITVERPIISRSNEQGQGYGIMMNANKSWIYLGNFYNCRGPVDFSSSTYTPPSRNGYVINCEIDGNGLGHDGQSLGGRGLGTHGPAENIKFISNKISNVSSAIRVRGKNVHSINNEFKNISTSYYHITDGADFKAFGDKTVFDTKREIKDFNSLTLPVYAASIQEEYDIQSSTSIENCVLYAKEYGILFSSSLLPSTIENFTATGNVFRLYGAVASGTAFIRSVSVKTANHSVINNNTYTGDTIVRVSGLTKGVKSYFGSEPLHQEGDETKNGILTLADRLHAKGSVYAYHDGTDVIKINNPIGGTRKLSGSADTGAIKISLPVLYSTTMMQFEVDIWDYSDNKPIKILVGGFCTSSGWAGTFAHIIGGEADRDFTVRFGDDGTKSCIWVGESDQVWSNLTVSVNNFSGFFGVPGEVWTSGWSITVGSITGTIKKIHSGNFPWSDWNKMKNIPTDILKKRPIKTVNNSTQYTFVDGDQYKHIVFTALTGDAIIPDEVFAASDLLEGTFKGGEVEVKSALDGSNNPLITLDYPATLTPVFAQKGLFGIKFTTTNTVTLGGHQKPA